jgi:hypothetical protein
MALKFTFNVNDFRGCLFPEGSLALLKKINQNVTFLLVVSNTPQIVTNRYFDHDTGKTSFADFCGKNVLSHAGK